MIKKRVVVVADSLAMPRNEEGGVVKYEETWPFLLAQEFPALEIINKGERARTIRTTKNGIEEILLLTPNIVIFQIGVVDGSPRIFTGFEKRILRRLPSRLRKYIINQRSKNRNRITSKNPLAKVEVKPNEYETVFREVINKLKNTNFIESVVLIPIVANFDYMNTKSKGFSENIKLYNTILDKLARETDSIFLPLENFNQENQKLLFTADGYHLNALGNSILAKSLLDVLKS